jgi:hypothetical protein
VYYTEYPINKFENVNNNELNSLLEKSHKIDCLNEEKYLEKIMSGKIIPMNK